MRRLLLGIVLIVLCACAACDDGGDGGDGRGGSGPAADPSAPGDLPTSATEPAVPLPDGTELRYVLHAPPRAGRLGPLPVVLVLHGNPGTPETMAEATRFDALADREGFLVVYPDNYGGPDEVPALLDRLAEEWRIDQRRIYAAGFSRGATAVYDLARSQADRIAAFAPVSGVSDSGFDLLRVPSLITFQGTADDLAPGFAPVNRQWARAAGCRAAPASAVRLGARRARLTVEQCARGAEHVVYAVERMGHEWPRPATRLVWDFFVAHPLDR
ncbi:PHB depolymerase family esterase [Nocardioides sp. MH1]|uniref:alpha/beta hydrolase family esterase n=1 Tax=Nocardioides sp. MH1 TaxID=3242490 RepID=UPI0035221AD5